MPGARLVQGLELDKRYCSLHPRGGRMSWGCISGWDLERVRLACAGGRQTGAISADEVLCFCSTMQDPSKDADVCPQTQVTPGLCRC